MTKILNCPSWLGSFPLNPFLKKLDELKSAEGKRRILILTKFRISLNTILITYTMIKYIIQRIDIDLSNDLDFLKKLDLVGQGVEVTADELPPSNSHLTHIDITSFIIFLNILMDDVTHFLQFLLRPIDEQTPQTKDFHKLKKTVSNFEGQKLEELSRIIQNTEWYEELKELRDKHIIHKGEKNSGIGRNGNNIGIYLRYRQKRKITEKYISNLEIDKYCENTNNFLKDLNEFLCKNFDYLPIEVTRKNP